MAGVDFELVLQVVMFITAVWSMGRLFKLFKQPAILGYLLVGILFGPNFFDIVPYASDGTCETMVVSHSHGSSSHRRLASSGGVNGSASCSEMAWNRYDYGTHIVPIWTMIGNVGAHASHSARTSALFSLMALNCARCRWA
jgi:hypothetical protein